MIVKRSWVAKGWRKDPAYPSTRPQPQEPWTAHREGWFFLGVIPLYIRDVVVSYGPH
jgi:hypothetical protein